MAGRGKHPDEKKAPSKKPGKGKNGAYHYYHAPTTWPVDGVEAGWVSHQEIDDHVCEPGVHCVHITTRPA